ncbi:hypothetical protein NL108_010230 [Boleophthalmus pectinirostris]|uniref:ras-related protein Rab-8B-like n=1 Tax=Boleophthalmus pectinirostris TaxID=150288 RepID=UPI000A1C2990|nr:ras-related protein Rab-8B-like [Boleophthalmus pectinirostris]KAJ0056526.1 hypothetical protein NL108_010230 [Boleophthalmus pectinirostris]
MAKCDYTLKLVIIGDYVVGKTCFLHRFVEGTFNGQVNVTIGANVTKKTVDLDGKKILLEIWDTAGHESFRKVIPLYCSQAKGIMLVYDVTNESTFDNLKDWISFIEEHAPSDADRILLGNKCDPNDSTPRQVSKERGEKFATDYGIKLLEVSAKSGINVEEAFFTLARDIMRRLPQEDNNALSGRGCSLL